MGKWDWGAKYVRARKEAQGIISALYSLNDLVQANSIDERRAEDFLEQARLANFSWRVFWPRVRGGRKSCSEAMRRAQGFVVFLHGWDSSHFIWEKIPAWVCAANPRLVALAPDVNGFGGSPFVDELPPLQTCDPAANMATIERWIELLGLRSSQRATRRWRVITLVGHSMSGASLFYLKESRWRPHEVARLAIAPALLINDALRKGFYRALGVGIWAGSTTDTLDWLKSKLAPSVVEMFIGAASRAVKNEHTRMFHQTPNGVLAQTFFAMGTIPHQVKPRHWRHFRVVLGHSDRLVGISSMLNLLEDLEFTSDQVRAVLGDHYLFSVSNQSRRLHTRNRKIVVEEILDLHRTCRSEMS